jgi:hypothetical protein
MLIYIHFKHGSKKSTFEFKILPLWASHHTQKHNELSGLVNKIFDSQDLFISFHVVFIWFSFVLSR